MSPLTKSSSINKKHSGFFFFLNHCLILVNWCKLVFVSPKNVIKWYVILSFTIKDLRFLLIFFFFYVIFLIVSLTLSPASSLSRAKLVQKFSAYHAFHDTHSLATQRAFFNIHFSSFRFLCSRSNSKYFVYRYLFSKRSKCHHGTYCRIHS